MHARRSREAVEEYLSRFRRATGCITDQPLIPSGSRVSDAPHGLSFAPPGHPVPLQAAQGRRGIQLSIVHEYRVIELPSDDPRGLLAVHPVSYYYDLLDMDGRELLAYHWHPDNPLGWTNWVLEPHLHVTSRIGALDLGARFDPLPIGELHLPTGHVSIETLMRFLIREVEITPRRADWARVLSESE